MSFGANDTTIEHGRLRVTPEHSCAALVRTIEEAMALGLIPLVIGPAPVDDPQQNERIQTLSDWISKVCVSLDVHFIGVVEHLAASTKWMTQVAAVDGAHPAAEGYDELADLILANGWADWLHTEPPG